MVFLNRVQPAVSDVACMYIYDVHCYRDRYVEIEDMYVDHRINNQYNNLHTTATKIIEVHLYKEYKQTSSRKQQYK